MTRHFINPRLNICGLGRSARLALLTAVSVALLSAQTMPWMHGNNDGINGNGLTGEICRSTTDTGGVSPQAQPTQNEANLNDSHTHCSVCVAGISPTQLPNFALPASWGLVQAMARQIDAGIALPPYLRPYAHAPPHGV